MCTHMNVGVTTARFTVRLGRPEHWMGVTKASGPDTTATNHLRRDGSPPQLAQGRFQHRVGCPQLGRKWQSTQAKKFMNFRTLSTLWKGGPPDRDLRPCPDRAPARTRTWDRQIRRLLLYPLSYGGRRRLRGSMLAESTAPPRRGAIAPTRFGRRRCAQKQAQKS